MKNEFGIGRDESVQLIVRACLENGVTHTDQIAYVLATAQHESMNFTRAEEINGRNQARARGYGGGEEFYGRGYVQLTHKENYEKFDRLLGLNGQLSANAELAKHPEIAAKILVIGMRDGHFRSHRENHKDRYELGEFVNAEKTDFYHARYVVNGITSKYPDSIRAAGLIEKYAHSWQEKVPSLVQTTKLDTIDASRSHRAAAPAMPVESTVTGLRVGAKGGDVRKLQETLRTLGHCGALGGQLAADGHFGQHTQEAVRAFQHAHGLKQDGIVGPKTLQALHDAEQSPSPLDPAHPDHALYRQTRAAVQRLDQAMARAPDAASERLAANLTWLAKQDGLSRVDHVVLSVENAHVRQGQNVFVVQGRLEDPAHAWAFARTQPALETPVVESFRQLDAFNQRQQREPVQQHAHPAPAHAQPAEYRDGPRMGIAP